MPYTHSDIQGHDKVVEFVRVYHLQVPLITLDQAERVLWIASSFSDPGEDWNRFEFFDAHDRKLASFTMTGY